MSPIIGSQIFADQVQVSRSDRWSIYQRLQDLMISCHCPNDGSLRVEVDSPSTAILVYSVVKQTRASREELVNWLERCQSVDCRS